MAVAKIHKLEIVGLEQDKENILSLLQKLGAVQLVDIRDGPKTITPAESSADLINLLEIEEGISYLAGFQEQGSLLGGMFKFKPLVYQQQLKEVITSFDYPALLKELAHLRNHIKNLAQHKEKLIQERHLLAPWDNLSIPLDELHSTQNCGIFLGVLRMEDYSKLLKDCQKASLDLFCEVTNQDKTNTYLAVIYLQDKFVQLEAIFKNYRFNFITLTRHKALVKDRLLEINREILVLDDQIQDAKIKIGDLAAEQFKLMVTYDYLANIKNCDYVEKKLAHQRFTFILSGWIRAKDEVLFKRTLGEQFKDTAVFISLSQDPQIPVDLENNRLVEPFEFITKIYGLPQYHELDPTPFMAPFFFLYFGFCLSDAGYGLMLILICWLALKKFRMGPQGLRFFRLFLFCGISTVIFGVLTGSWFGNLLDIASQNAKAILPLKKVKDALIVLDPLKEPTKLLGIALSLGIIQVWFGNIVAIIGNLKNKRYWDIFLDQVAMLTLLFGLTGLGLVFLKLIANTHLVLFKYAALGGALALILTQGRTEKGLGAKLFYGIYNLYSSLSGYLSDILSYSRLWALGLVTGVMANTINLISVQFSQIIVSFMPLINKIGWLKILFGSLILLIIFIFGHTVAFFMNILGAFVHPVRLQFVEFFSKFFKSGGRTFKPFKVESKYINIG